MIGGYVERQSKFEVGDRFEYTTSGYQGKILAVQNLAGTVRAVYDSGTTEHVLAANLLTNLTRPEPIPMNALHGVSLELTGSQDVAVYGLRDTDFVNYASEPGLLRVSTLKKHEERANIGIAFEDHDARTNQLLNELYHDRSRLEKLVQHAAELARDSAEALAALLNKDYGDADQPQSDELVAVCIAGAKLGEFAEANE